MHLNLLSKEDVFMQHSLMTQLEGEPSCHQKTKQNEAELKLSYFRLFRVKGYTIFLCMVILKKKIIINYKNVLILYLFR